MSLKLILYPQNYNGQYNVVSTNPNEFVVNGIYFTNFNSTTSYDAGSPFVVDTLASSAPVVPNTWYRSRSTATGTPTAPTESSGNVTLYAVATLSYSGMYQQLSGLSVGASYDLTLTISSSSGTVNSMLIMAVYSGTTYISAGVFLGPTATSYSHTFTATSPNHTIFLYYRDLSSSNITISNVSVIPTGTTPTGTDTLLQDGQVICDLYEDEDIPLTLSVDDFKNAAEQVQSYTKAFNLPATKRNNQIFDNIFEITRSDDGVVFNPYRKTQCQLKQDGFILFEGYLRLIDIQDKEGEISYNVNLYSEVIALADVISELDFNNLDFTELSHTYDKTNIKNSWNDSPAAGISYTNASTSGFRDDNTTLKYPFVDWTGQIPLADGTTGSNATLNMPEMTTFEQAFRPFIQIKYLINRIFEPTPFSYTSNFFDDADFEKLYMDFNWGDSLTPSVFNTTGTMGNTVAATLASGSFSTISWLETNLSSDFGYSGGVFTAITDNQIYTLSGTLFFANLSTGGVLYGEWVHSYTGGETIYNPVSAQTVAAGATNIYAYNFNFTATLQTGDTLFFRAYYTGTAVLLSTNTSTAITVTTTADGSTTSTLVQTLRGELNQWDFLKGIMTMFNLVSIPDKSNPNNILIEPYGDIFLNNPNSVQLDWTDKVDVSEIKLTPLTELNKKTIFKFVEDDDDYAFSVYKKAVDGHLYGSKIFDASGFTILEGEEEIIPEPFAATVPKPLMPQFPDFVTPAIYSYNPNDGTSEGFDNSPRIMYNNGAVTMANTTYYIPGQNGTFSENATTFLQFTHLTDIPTVVSVPPVSTDTSDFHFGECQLINPIGNASVNNLFNVYWLPYFAELYNPDTRIMSIKVNLTPGDVNSLNMFDTVFIKNREFRINKIDYKPNDLATVEFILIP
jgi:hypothetical protein